MIRRVFGSATGLFLMSIGSIAWANSASLSLKNDQYIRSGSAFYRDTAAANDTSLSIDLNREWRLRKSIKGTVDLKNEYSGSEKWNYLNVYQAYVSAKFPGPVQLDVGRRLDTWSATDEEWKQGLFEPRYLQNKMNPERAGLTGVFASGSLRSFLVTAAVLPVFVPDFAAHVNVEDHHLVSKNPWFNPPTDTYFINAPSEIRYDIDRPSVARVMAHPGFALKIEESRAESGYRLAAAYKPVPQLLFRFPVEHQVVINTNSDYLDVRIEPVVVYHGVVSTDSWTRLGAWTLTAGMAYDQPENVSVRPGSITQTYKPAWVWSLLASRALGTEGSEAARLKLGLLKIDGGLGKDQGEFARDPSLFEGRFQYSEAYLAAVSWPIRGLLKRPLWTEGRVVVDRLQNGGSLGFSARYEITREWEVNGDADFLGLFEGRAQNENGFFSTYRANDRVGLGMSYVF